MFLLECVLMRVLVVCVPFFAIVFRISVSVCVSVFGFMFFCVMCIILYMIDC